MTVRVRPGPIAVLISGGLDSGVLLAQLVRRERVVQPLYIRSGLFWETAERYWLRRFLRAIARPCLQPLVELVLPAQDLYGPHWSVSGRGTPGHDASADSNYLPGRNLLLLSKAAVFCAAHRIDVMALAVLKDNPFPDATQAFFERARQLLRVGLGTDFAIHTPFRRMGKAGVIRRAGGVPLQLTFSCARPRGRWHCGRCTKCAERQRAFAAACVADPTRYRA